MYERYAPSDRVFVDREEQLNWMTTALTRCQEKSVVLHLRGIGGIGKTALLDYWHNTIDTSIFIDCEQITNIHSRLDALAKGAVRLGIKLRRFDLLWSIRLRFVQGIEPAKEPGRSWAFDVIKPLPFIGSLVNIGKAISTIGSKLSPQLKRRFGDVASWLQTRLGKDYTEKLLEILWKDPRRAEILFLDALLEDLNTRKDNQTPLLLQFDHYEEVDNEKLKWRFNNQKISEAELWYEFLATLINSVGVTASRKGLPKRLGSQVAIEEIEITELDARSCRDLLSQHDIKKLALQDQILSVSGGNPFVINTICDMVEFGTLTAEDIETLRADTLEEVRLKTWRRLFNKAEGLMEIIDFAGILPFFNRQLMDLIIPHLKTDHWDRLTKLSFVQDRGDGTWKIHDLAQDLVIAELGDKLDKLALDISESLERASKEQPNVTFQGIGLSVLALVDEPKAIEKAGEIATNLNWQHQYQEGLSLLACIRFHSEESKAMLQWHRARILYNIQRYAEAEQDLREVLSYFRTQAKNTPVIYTLFVAWTLTVLAGIFGSTGRISEAETTFQEALQLFNKLTQQEKRPMFGLPDIHLERLIWTNRSYAEFLESTGQFSKAEIEYEKSLELIRNYAQIESKYEVKVAPSPRYQEFIDWHTSDLVTKLAYNYINSSKPLEAEEAIQEGYRIASQYKNKGQDHWLGPIMGSWINQNFAYVLMRTGRHDEAEPLLHENIKNMRGLLQKSPVSVFHLVSTLNIQAILLRHLRNFSKAEDTFQESLKIYREFYKEEPFSQPQDARVLNNLAIVYQQNKRFNDAEAAYRETLKIHRDLADQAPEHNLPQVARSLTNFAVLLRQTDRLEEAEVALREALKIRRKLAEEEPTYFREQLATSLNNLGPVLAVSNQLPEAETALKEALQLRRDLAEKAPSLHLSELASTLNNLGIIFTQTERFPEAEQAYLEALSIFEKLVASVPQMFHAQLVKVLTNLRLLRAEFDNLSVPTEMIQQKLQELNVIESSEVEEWIEDEEDSYFL